MFVDKELIDQYNKKHLEELRVEVEKTKEKIKDIKLDHVLFL